jgi:hypothetical protein
MIFWHHPRLPWHHLRLPWHHSSVRLTRLSELRGWVNELHMGYAAEWATHELCDWVGYIYEWVGYAAEWATQLDDRLFRLNWMRTTFSTELNENDFFIWIAAEWSTQLNDEWSTQRSDRRSEMIDAAKWSTQRNDRRSEMIDAARWSTQRSDRRSEMIDYQYFVVFFWRCELACSRCLPESRQARK